MSVQIETSGMSEQYSKSNNLVNKIIPFRNKSMSTNQIAEGVHRVRKALGYTQTQFAQALGVSQANVAKWESGKLNPPGQIFAAIARMAPEEEQAWWMKLAGVVQMQPPEDEVMRTIPLLRDSSAVGTPRSGAQAEIEAMLSLPRFMLPRGGKITAFHVKGNAMAPYIHDGYIVLVDETQRDPGKLVNKMIAARDDEGVSVKWLRQDVGYYLLVPERVTAKTPVRVLKKEDGWGILGAVVKLLGDPPSPKK
jgi:SOS-response transcriptional repressor LexA